jgi:KDO2-lipid IV(A) lauroyltransferase
MNLLLIGLLNGIAHIPCRAMMRFSKILAQILKLLRYRRRVVDKNLKQAFPTLAQAERDAIASKFYTHLSSRICEGLLVNGISKAEILERVKIPGIEEVHQWFEKGREVVIVLGHSGPWEWAGLSTSLQVKHIPYTVVSRVGNPTIDRWLKQGRSRFGMNLVDMNNAASLFFGKEKQENPSLTIFVCDQSPSNAARAIRTIFFGRETAFFPGPFLFAARKRAVMYRVSLLPEGNHHYKVELDCISEDCSKENPRDLCSAFAAGLEQDIRKNPADWLWSHKRWKHELDYES